MWSLVPSILALGAYSVAALPQPKVIARGDPAPLTQQASEAFTPFANFAAAAYCPTSQTSTWSCGANCDALPGFVPTATGGDGDAVPFWFVGFFPSMDAVIVGHQGTNPEQFVEDLEDADFFLSSLDPNLFPGISSSIQAHSGFQDVQASTATDVLNAVQSTLDTHGTNNVILASHSLGAATALLDAVFLQVHLPSITFKVVNFGLPRVGNQAFANYVDASGIAVTRVNNEYDIVPILPGRFLGFIHPSGEVHIEPNTGQFVSCEGQEDESDGCEDELVPTIFEGSIPNHLGPYNGIFIGGCEST